MRLRSAGRLVKATCLGGRTRLSLLATLAVLALPAVARAEEGVPQPVWAPPTQELITAYARDYAVGESEAARRLSIQARAGALVQKLKNELGDSFAGIWIDPTTGRVGIGQLQSSPEVGAAIRRAVADQQLETDTDIVAVRASSDDIEAAQYTLGIELREAIAAGRVVTQADDAGNRVRILLTATATSDDWTRARTLQAEFASGRVASGPPRPVAEGGTGAEPRTAEPARKRIVTLELEKSRQLTFKTAVTCSSESCSPPLRAGVKTINNGDGRQCSAGFVGRWWSGSGYEYFIMTAGHCIKGTNSNWHWRAYNPATGTSSNIGLPWTWRYGANYGNVYPGLSLDIGIIHIDAGGYWGTGITNALWMRGWPSGVLWTVSAQTAAFQGEYGCRSGSVTSYTCGTISTVNGTGSYHEGEGGVSHLLFVPGACLAKGDSGGPFVDGGTALGITSGWVNKPDGSCDFGVYAHAEDIGNWLGVWALTF